MRTTDLGDPRSVWISCECDLVVEPGGIVAIYWGGEVLVRFDVAESSLLLMRSQEIAKGWLHGIPPSANGQVDQGDVSH